MCYCCVKCYHRFSSLKQHPSLYSSLGKKTRNAWMRFFAQYLKRLKSKCQPSCVLIYTLMKEDSLLRLLSWSAKFYFLWLYNEEILFPCFLPDFYVKASLSYVRHYPLCLDMWSFPHRVVFFFKANQRLLLQSAKVECFIT